MNYPSNLYYHSKFIYLYIIQLEYTIEGVNKIPVNQEQVYFPRQSQGK